MYHLIITVDGYWGLSIREKQSSPVSNTDIEYWEEWYSAKYAGKKATVINVYETTGD